VSGRAGVKAAVLGQLQIRRVNNLDGRAGELLDLGDLGVVLVHHDDGGASCALVVKGATTREYTFPPELMDKLVEWAAGPLRTDEQIAESLGYCGACIAGRCKDCKGSDACECDHKARIVTP